MGAEDKGKIKQGTIAGFMRKRTQLVGFEFGYWKHSQYGAEFLDNALDAIESFQWKEIKKGGSNLKFSLDQELSLESLSIVQNEVEDEVDKTQPLNEGAKQSLMQEFGLGAIAPEVAEIEAAEGDSEVIDEVIEKDEIEVEAEVKNILNKMEELIRPVEDIIDDEPITIIRLYEYEAPAFLTSELSQKNVMAYSFEVFDNGTGMISSDLKKYGKYLASSKSIELKQTRGSQGFGAPSAFSDSQNTTGRPIVVISKSIKEIYATVSEFFTTSKNEKKYIVAPTEVDCPFLHGTYINLHYLNVKYVRGYIDVYLKETALMNPHITLIYIDPYNEEFIYPRKVSAFPDQPKYAKPHPSSTNIGDLQDLITKSENLTVSAFLQENFVRVSPKTAKDVLEIASRDLEKKLGFLALKDSYIVAIKSKKELDSVHYARFEKRAFGRSKKTRATLVPYLIKTQDLKDKYWEVQSKYLQFNRDQEKLRKEIKKEHNRMEKSTTKKEEKEIERGINKIIKEINGIEKNKENLKVDLNKLFKDLPEGLEEVKDDKKITDIEDLIKQIQIDKTKPLELSTDQFNSLFLAFKSIKYQTPPTDTAIPVGEIVLENTLIKELGLKVSENLDDYDIPVNDLIPIIEVIKDQKKFAIKTVDPMVTEEALNDISVDLPEVLELNTKIMKSFIIDEGETLASEFVGTVKQLTEFDEASSKDEYREVIEYFIINYTRDDDFIAAETRAPTSGKGLAYVVEAVMAYSNNSKTLETPKRSRDVLSRFVNRTPKLRDSADCAITKAVQSVNWKNYKLEKYDNGLPRGPLKLLVNVSGPYVHLMFKSQSKNSLADDERLVKEIKTCLEAIGRRLKIYINRRQNLQKDKKRASLIDKHIPQFVKSVYNIASQGSTLYKNKITVKELETLMRQAIGKKEQPKLRELKDEPSKLREEAGQDIPETKPIVEGVKEEDEIPQEIEMWTIKKLRDYCNVKNISIPAKIKKIEIIYKIKKYLMKVEGEEAPVAEERVVPEEIPSREQEKPREREQKPREREQKPREREQKPIKKQVQKPAEPYIQKYSSKSLQNWTNKELREYCKSNEVKILSKDNKTVIIKKILKFYDEGIPVEKPKEPVKVTPLAPGTIAAKREQLKIAQGKVIKPAAPPKPRVEPPKPKTTQTKLPLITTDNIVKALSNEWQTIKHLIFTLKIRDMMDARFLQIKLKDLERKKMVLMDVKMGKKHWKLKK